MKTLSITVMLVFSFLVAQACKQNSSGNKVNSGAVSQAVENTVIKEQAQVRGNIFDRFFLVRPPDFLSMCKEKFSNEKAVLVLGPDSDLQKINIGDSFFIALETALVKGTLERIVSPCENDFNVDRVSFGLLDLDKKVVWRYSSDSYLAIKGKYPSPEEIGTVELLPEGSEKVYSNIIREQIPINEDFFVEEMVRVNLPKSVGDYDFLSVSHFDRKDYEQAGDKALQQAGYLFAKNNKDSKPVIMDYMTKLIGITNLDSDGVYEVLIHNGGIYGGHYEMRLFDGKRFSNVKKVLYHWMD